MTRSRFCTCGGLNKFLILTLPPRQRQLFELLMSGKRDFEIAEAMNLSPRTVYNTKTAVMRKLGVCNLADLVRVGIRAGY